MRVSFSMLMYYDECVMRLKVCQKLRIFHHRGFHWFLSCAMACHSLKRVPCPLPSCFTSIRESACVAHTSSTLHTPMRLGGGDRPWVSHLELDLSKWYSDSSKGFKLKNVGRH